MKQLFSIMGFLLALMVSVTMLANPGETVKNVMDNDMVGQSPGYEIVSANDLELDSISVVTPDLKPLAKAHYLESLQSFIVNENLIPEKPLKLPDIYGNYRYSTIDDNVSYKHTQDATLNFYGKGKARDKLQYFS